jgi:hypothetical protein
LDAHLVELVVAALGPEANLAEELKRTAGVIFLKDTVAEDGGKAISAWKPGMIRPCSVEKVELRSIEEVDR